jgi:putative transposase
LGQYINGTVRHIEIDPNAWGECNLWTFNGDIESLSCLAEPGILSGDAGENFLLEFVELTGEYVKLVILPGTNINRGSPCRPKIAHTVLI